MVSVVRVMTVMLEGVLSRSRTQRANAERVDGVQQPTRTTNFNYLCASSLLFLLCFKFYLFVHTCDDTWDVAEDSEGILMESSRASSCSCPPSAFAPPRTL